MLRKVFLLVLALGFIAFGCKNSNTNPQTQEQKPDPNAIAQNQVVLKAPDSDTISDKTKVWSQDFEQYAEGQLPQGWSQYSNGPGKVDWKILKIDNNKVLAQTQPENPNNHFNVVVYDSLEAKDVDITVRLLAVSGRHDQGGGIIWRFQDKDNYYIVRANPLEDNVVLYRVKDGKRRDLPLLNQGRTYGTKVKNMGKGWHTLRLTAQNDTFTVYFNGKELFKVVDQTFSEPGKIGLWTKADAVTYFDDLNVIVK